MIKFLSKLTGSDSDYDYFEDPKATRAVFEGKGEERKAHIAPKDTWDGEPAGELAVDVYQTADAIVVKAFIAGVQPNTVDIALTREMVTISGTRSDEREVEDDSYFQKELFWGSFSRTIILPEEIDVDMAEATERHGVLIVRLPKINKKKETKLKVRAR